MKWKEQLRKDKQTLAGLAPRQKMLFIWDYYKLPILSLLLVAVLAGAGAAAAARSAHTAFYAVMVNANNEVQADPFTPLLEQGGVDMTGKVSTSRQTIPCITTMPHSRTHKRFRYWLRCSESGIWMCL